MHLLLLSLNIYYDGCHCNIKKLFFISSFAVPMETLTLNDMLNKKVICSKCYCCTLT